MIILLPKSTVFEKKECSFCHEECLSVALDAETSQFVEKAEGVEDGYRLHECDKMMQAIERAIETLTGSEDVRVP